MGVCGQAEAMPLPEAVPDAELDGAPNAVTYDLWAAHETAGATNANKVHLHHTCGPLHTMFSPGLELHCYRKYSCTSCALCIFLILNFYARALMACPHVYVPELSSH